METSIIIAGFGGQGALLAGQILAQAAMNSGKEVTWLPSYGPEMRGGTAHCTVVIGDEPIASPLVRNPDCAIVMNQPSADKYAPLLRMGGLLIVNSSLVSRPVERSNIETVLVPASDLALSAGDVRLTNMVLLGELVRKTGIVTLEAVEQALKERLPERYQSLLAANIKVLYKVVDSAFRPVNVAHS